MSNKHKPRALVTGGSGFIGTNLCEELLKRDWAVVALDNFYTSTKKNTDHLREHPDYDFIRADVRSIQSHNIAFSIDRVYNLACPASPTHYQRDPIFTSQTCTEGAIAVLNLAKARGIPVLQASTSEIYGDPEVHPQNEDYHGNVNTLGPRACYDEGKRCAESLFMDYHRTHNVDIKIARIFNTYGPYMDPGDGRVVSNFIVQAIRGERFTIYGSGKQTRSFCYVDDLVCGLIKLMESNYHQPVNLGNPNEFTLLELASHVAEIKARKGQHAILDLKYLTEFKELPEDDPKQRCPDISLAKKVLDWEPKVQLIEGLEKTYQYFREIVK